MVEDSSQIRSINPLDAGGVSWGPTANHAFKLPSREGLEVSSALMLDRLADAAKQLLSSSEAKGFRCRLKSRA
jgi:hypothetical protein